MAIHLDARDIQILEILTTEGRISKSEIARRVNLSPSPCWERIKRLEQAGLITGYHAEIDLARLSSHMVIFVMVELDAHSAESFRTFETAVADTPEITQCWALGGGFDYLMQVVAPDITRYQRMIDALLEAGLGVKRYFTYVVTKDVKSGPAPFAQFLSEQ